jgi:hypothetical protein
MKTITIRLEDNLLKMLSEVDYKPTTAAQNIIELFTYLRRATLIELKGILTEQEITVLADIYNGVMPVWRYLSSKEMLIAEVEDGEHLEEVCSRHGVDFNILIEKIKGLTSAQVAILQMELYRFWNVEGDGGYGSPSPDLKTLYKTLT